MGDDLSMDFPACYRIRVNGAVNEIWSEYYDNMTVDTEAGSRKQPITTLTGCVADQAALQGILLLLYNMQLPILSVEWLPEET